MPIPKILVVAPPPIVEPKGPITSKFNDAEKRSIGLAEEFKKVAHQHSTDYFDAASVTEASLVDGIHLDENQHELLGEAIALTIAKSLPMQNYYRQL